MSQDDRLLPLPALDRSLERQVRGDYSPSRSYGVVAEPTHLRDYLFIILKRKWLILSIVVVVTSIAAIQMYRLPSVYEAASTILIEPKPQSVFQTQGIVINQGDPMYWNTQLQLLQSPALARQVAIQLDLPNNPDFFGTSSRLELISSLRKLFQRSASTRAVGGAQESSDLPVLGDSQLNAENLTPEQLAKLEPYERAISGGMTVEAIPTTNLVNLRFRHTNPELSQKVVNMLGQVFVYRNIERETAGSSRAYDLLAKEVAELQLKIKRGEEERLNYARNHNLPQADTPGADLEGQRLATLSAQLLDAENDLKLARSKYEAALTDTNPYNIPEVQTDERIRELRQKIETLKEKRASLMVVYTAEWPDVKKVDEQLKPLEDALAKAPREVIDSLKSRYLAAQKRVNYLNQDYQRQRGTTSQQNADQIQMSVIKQNLETDKQLYNTLLQRQREIQISSNDKVNNVSIAEEARVPKAPVGPPRLRNVLIAFLLALAAGIGLAFLLDFLDDTVKSIEDVDRYVHLPALALIPAARADRLRLKDKVIGTRPDESASTALALIEDVRSPLAEAYRHLRTSLLLSSAGQPPRTILVTSSQPSEGKTTTAVNTAVMLAQTGADVVLIDCDLRRPRVHHHFGLSNVRGITNCLSGESEIDSLLQPYDRLPNLKLIVSGPVPPNPSELLGSEEMRKLLSKLANRFAHVVVDSPPVISFTDASILSTMTDGVVLVVHGGRSSRAVVRRAKQQLLDVGAHIFGVVLNNVKLESQNYYYYAGYYSRYYTDDDASDSQAADEAHPSNTT